MESFFIITEKNFLIYSILSTILFIFLMKSHKLNKDQAKWALCIYLSFEISIFALYFLKAYIDPAHAFIYVWIIFAIINIFISKKLKVYSPKIGLFFAMFIIIVTQFGYSFYTPYWSRQHDSRSFVNYESGGHFGYIGYIFFNHHLPTVSPRDYWCFFNPPLFYIISTIVIKIQNIFGYDFNSCFEGLQVMSTLYSIIFIVYIYRILKELDLKKVMIFPLLFVGLSPAIIIMSGSINNDILSIMLSTMAIYYTIKWYKSDSLKDLIKIALTISLAIMTKISSALVAVAIAFVFLHKVIHNKKDIVRYIKCFSIFALISLPIGLWYPIKNYVLYDIPFTYVQSVSEDNDTNISKHGILERFFTVSQGQLKSINIDMTKENAEYNLFITTLKSFIVDEHIDYENNYILSFYINMLFALSIIITLIYIVNIVYILKNYKKLNNPWIIFFLLLFILEIVSYIKFCFDFPFTFTMNFRYIVSTLITYSVLTGIAMNNNKKLYNLNSIYISLFAVFSILMFATII